MPALSASSSQLLEQCDPRLQKICEEAIKIFDFKVLCGHRGEQEQNALVKEGKSKTKFPESKHNSLPSKAVDIAPFPINWNDEGKFKLLAGIMFGVASMQGVKLRWGGDWNCNWDCNDQTFNDLVHFELID